MCLRAISTRARPGWKKRTYVNRCLAIGKLAELSGAPPHAQAVADAIDKRRVRRAAEYNCTTHLGWAEQRDIIVVVELGNRKHFGRACACQVGPSNGERVAGAFVPHEYESRREDSLLQLQHRYTAGLDLDSQYYGYRRALSVVACLSLFLVGCTTFRCVGTGHRHATQLTQPVQPSNHDCYLEHASPASLKSSMPLVAGYFTHARNVLKACRAACSRPRLRVLQKST
jgi:hypothetical protein